MPGSIRFEDKATTVDGPAAPRAPTAGPTGSHPAVGKVGPLFDRRALVEDALAQLRARNRSASQTKGEPETEDERTRRRQRRDKREGRDHRLQELYEAALADLDKPPSR